MTIEKTNDGWHFGYWESKVCYSGICEFEDRAWDAGSCRKPKSIKHCPDYMWKDEEPKFPKPNCQHLITKENSCGETVLVYCTHKNNKDDYEGNCQYENCPL